MNVTAYQLAERFVGMCEVPGAKDNPQIMSMLNLDHTWPESDEVAWCSGFINYIAWLLRLPRSKSLLARSWLGVGTPIRLYDGVPSPGFDIVILKRGGGPQPGADNMTAPGHVGFLSGYDSGRHLVYLLGGNQGDAVCVKGYSSDNILGVRRLWTRCTGANS